MVRKLLVRSGSCGVPLLLVVWLAFWSSFLSQPTTPYGVQCPTASTQTATDCCGKTVRTLRPGDKGFVQCRCAEKKSAQAKLAGTPKPVLVLASVPRLPSRHLLPSQLAIEARIASYLSVTTAPSVHPPDPA